MKRALAGAVALLMTTSVAAAVVHDDQGATSRLSLAGDAPVDEPVDDTTETSTAAPESTTTTVATEPAAASSTTTTRLRPPRSTTTTTSKSALAWLPSPENCPPKPTPFSPDQNGVYAVPATGGPGRLILSSGPGSVPQGISYSPDGRQIAYTRSGPTTLHIANADGSDERSIGYQGDWLNGAFWSTDGRYLAYSAGIVATQTTIVNLYELATGAVFTVYEHAKSMGVKWSPDGRWLAFNHFEEPGVWVADVAGVVAGTSSAVQVADDRAWGLSWSPDSARLAIGRVKGGGTYVLNRDGTGRRLVHERGIVVAWSPVDPSRLAVDEGGLVWLVNLDTGAATALAPFSLNGWLSDGSRIMATSPSGAHLVRPDGCWHTVSKVAGFVASSPGSTTILMAKATY
jgi:Tol biopolymer transport system component